MSDKALESQLHLTCRNNPRVALLRPQSDRASVTRSKDAVSESMQLSLFQETKF